jgi:hypothetical protein
MLIGVLSRSAIWRGTLIGRVLVDQRRAHGRVAGPVRTAFSGD